MSDDFTISRATDADYQLLNSMHKVGWPRSPVYGMPDNSYWWIVKDHAGIPAAMCGITLDPVSKSSYLCRSVVLPAYRGRGIQRRMIRTRVSFARSQGMRDVVTDTIDNVISTNHLIDEGFRLFNPPAPWGNDGALYLRKALWK